MEGVEVFRFRYFWPARAQILASGDGVAANLRASWTARLQAPFFVMAELVALVRIGLRWKPDVVNAHWLIPQGVTAGLARFAHRARVVLHVHAADVYFLQRFVWGPWVARFAVKKADLVYADGSHVRDALDAMLKTPSGAQLRPMGVSVSRFTPGGQPEGVTPVPGRILFVGRLVEKKGVAYLIRALKLVRQQIPDAHLVIAGSGPLQRELEEAAEHLGLSQYVDFLGPLPHSRVVEELHRADIACVPSIIDSLGETEGMPTVVLEAMASGTKVVGSEVNGIPDVLRHEVNGWLATPADPDSLAAALLAALSSPPYGEISQRAMATASGHDWQSLGASYLEPLGEVHEAQK